MALAHRVVGAHLHAVRVVELAGVLRDVLGNVDHHRARAAGGRDVERLLHGRGEVGDVLHQEVVLDDRARDPDGVALLERVQADRRGRHLTVITTIGIESMYAVAMPVTALVTPGPEVTSATPIFFELRE